MQREVFRRVHATIISKSANGGPCSISDIMEIHTYENVLKVDLELTEFLVKLMTQHHGFAGGIYVLKFQLKMPR